MNAEQSVESTSPQESVGTYSQPTNRHRKSFTYRFVLTGLGFTLLLILPSLDQWLGFSADFKSTEKNILTPLPGFHFPHVRTYIQQFNQYYKENFGWRNALFYQYSRLKYSAFGVSPLPQKVVLGKNEWFYPGNDFNRVSDQHQGLTPLSGQTLQTIARKLVVKQQELAKRGINFYLIVAPDSYSIYPENLPDYLQASRYKSNFDHLKEYLRTHTTIPFIDVRPSLIAAKSVHPTYMRTDTHWNEYGALVATLSIVKHIRHDFQNIPLPDENMYNIHLKEGYAGDLVTMLALNQSISDKINYQIDLPASLQAKEVEEIPNTELGGWPTQRFVSTNKKAPNLLFIGDSFTLSLRQFTPSYFANSYIIRSNYMSEKLLRSEKPDIVIFEVVERNLTNLADL